MHTGATSESAPSSVPVNKTNVPCYFYFNGFCNKGDRCCFLHDVNADAPPCEKLVKTTLAKSEAPNVGNNTFPVWELGSAPANKPVIQQKTNKTLVPSATATATATANIEAHTMVQPKEDIQLLVPEDVAQQSGASPISVSECEETATIRSDSLPAGEFVRSISYACEENSSEEQVDGPIDPEERWESSPGFDVLVDNESENLDSEDDPEYMMALDGARRDLNSHFLGYDFENQVEYDRYREMELQYGIETCRRYDYPVSEDIFGDVENNPGHADVRMLDSFLSRKELAFGNQRHADLRDHLRRRKFIDSHSVTGLSRMRESSQLIGRNHERPLRHVIGRMRLLERRALDVGGNTIDSLGNNGTYSNGGRRHGFPRHSQKYQSRRQHFKEKRLPKRRFLSSEISSERRVPRERISTRESTKFSGPKTLSQIREEKRKPEEDGDFTRKMRSYGRKSSVDFQGPKPLSEILKEKGKLTCET